MMNKRFVLLALVASLLIFPAPSWCKKKKKKDAPEPALYGAAGKLEEMVNSMKSKGLLNTAEAGELIGMAEEVSKEFKGYQENALRSDELRTRYEQKMKEMEETHKEMVAFKESFPEDIVETERELRNAKNKIEKLQQEGKEWESEVSRLALDMKKAYDMHKEDRRELKQVEERLEKKDNEIDMLKKEVENTKRQFVSMREHVDQVDSMKADFIKEDSVQTAMKLKDERIAFLKENNLRLTENHNQQVKRFREQIESLEAERDRLMARGPHRKEVLQLQEETKIAKQEAQDCKTSLIRKEELYEEAKLARNNLVQSVTSWNKKYADCVAESNEMQKKLEESSSESVPFETDESSCAEELQSAQNALNEKNAAYDKLKVDYNEYYQTATSLNARFSDCMKEMRYFKKLYKAAEDEITRLNDAFFEDKGRKPETRSDSNLDKERIASLEKEVEQCKETKEDNLKLREELQRKKETIKEYEQYTDKDQCMKDRLRQQQNLDRMAQENMKFANCNVKRNKLQKKYDKLLNETSGLGNDCSQLDTQLVKLNKANNKLKADLESTQTELAQLQTDHNELDKRYKHLTQASKVKQHKMQIEIDHFKGKHDECTESNKVLEENLKPAPGVDYSAYVADLQQQRDRLMTSRMEDEHTIGSLRTELDEAEATIEKLEKLQNPDSKEAADWREGEIDKLTKKLELKTKLKEKLAEENKKLIAYNRELSETVDSLRDEETSSAECNEPIMELKKKLEEKETQIQNQKGVILGQADDIKQRIGQLKALEESGQSECSKQDAEVTSLKTELSDVKQRLERSTKLKDKLATEFKECEEQNEELKTRNEKQEGLIKGLDKEIDFRVEQVKKIGATHERALAECQCKAETNDADSRFISNIKCEDNTATAASDCNKQDVEIAQMKADIEKKDELISFLRGYNDPTGCMADRVKMQKNLDRMAQENMKFANCNVRKKKVEAKVETLTTKANELESKVTDLEKEVTECQQKLEEQVPAIQDGVRIQDGGQPEVAQLQQDITKKDELIEFLRKYNDPTGCMADRVSMQKNLDRMAQENMKFANCNVRKKKTEAKLEKCQEDLSKQDMDYRVQLADARNHAGEVNMENDRLRHEVQKWKKTHNQIHEKAKELGQSVEQASEIIVLQTQLEIKEDTIGHHKRIINGQKEDIQRRAKEFLALTETHEKALNECDCKAQGEGDDVTFVSNVNCDVTTGSGNDVTGNDRSGNDVTILKTKLEEMEKQRDKYKADFIEFSGKHTECKMERHNATGWNLHYSAVIKTQKKQLEALQNDCNCEQATICDENTGRFEEFQDRALNCENTLKFTREKVEKYTTLHAAASKNYTELREECQGYYDNLQLCTQEKSEIEFVRNGQDMVLKQIENDHKKKMGNLEETTKDAVKNEQLYRGKFWIFATSFTLLALYNLFTYLKRRFTEDEVKIKEQKQAAKSSSRDSKKKR